MRRNVDNFCWHAGRIQFRIKICANPCTARHSSHIREFGRWTGHTLDNKTRALGKPDCVLHVRLVTLGIIPGEWFPEWRVDYRYLHDTAAKAQNEVEVGVYSASASQLCDFVKFEN